MAETLPTTAVESIAKCVSCGGELHGKFCSACGEREPGGYHYSLTHFALEAFEGLTHADNSLFRTLRLLLICPGRLTREFLAGRRKLYLGPVQLFLVVNLLFFVLQPTMKVGTFNATLKVHTTGSPYSRYAQRLVEDKLAKTHQSYEQFSNSFNHAEKLNAKGMVILMVPMFALVLGLMELRRHYAVQHLVFSLHFYTFLMLLALLTAGPLRLLMHLWRTGSALAWERGITLALLIVVGLYLYRGLREGYGNQRLGAALRALGLALSSLVILQVYRFILFHVTLTSL